MLIVIEGIDSGGKATHSKLLAERLKGTRFSFPNYDSVTGKAILGHLKLDWAAVMLRSDSENSSPLDAVVFQCLQTVNRIEQLPAIYEAMKHGPVIFDRYYQSAYVYGALDGVDPTWNRSVQESAMPPADVNILLDITVEESFKRRPERRDRYEADRRFLEKVRGGYLTLWKERSETGIVGWPVWTVVDGMESVQAVQEKLLDCLRGRGMVIP